MAKTFFDFDEIKTKCITLGRQGLSSESVEAQRGRSEKQPKLNKGESRFSSLNAKLIFKVKLLAIPKTIS